jgi:hypothetical protein
MGWICAIITDYITAQALLDEEHGGPNFVSPDYTNDYTLGKMGKQNGKPPLKHRSPTRNLGDLIIKSIEIYLKPATKTKSSRIRSADPAGTLKGHCKISLMSK